MGVQISLVIGSLIWARLHSCVSKCQLFAKLLLLHTSRTIWELTSSFCTEVQ